MDPGSITTSARSGSGVLYRTAASSAHATAVVAGPSQYSGLVLVSGAVLVPVVLVRCAIGLSAYRAVFGVGEESEPA
jgi:hypothetical protein